MNTASNSGVVPEATKRESPKSSPSIKTKPGAKKSRRKGLQPYTPYTIYFRLERLRILQFHHGFPPPPSYDPSHYDPNEHPRPSKYVNTKLPPFWYSSASRAVEEKTRKHRKLSSNGPSKEDLTGMISRSWKNVDHEVYVYCKRLSDGEKRRIAQAQKAHRDNEVARSDDMLGLLTRGMIAPNAVQIVTTSNISLNYTHSAEQMRAPLKKRPIQFTSTGSTSTAKNIQQNDYISTAPLMPNPLPRGCAKSEESDVASALIAMSDTITPKNTAAGKEPDNFKVSASPSSFAGNPSPDKKLESCAVAPITISNTSQAPPQPRLDRSQSIGEFSYEKIQVENRQVKYGRLVSIAGEIKNGT